MMRINAALLCLTATTLTLSAQDFPEADIPYGTATADGVMESMWDHVPANHLEVDIDGTNPAASDLDGYWKAVWDEENLYLLMVTMDDTTVAYPGEAFWNYDMTEVFIDPDNSKGEDYDGVNDSQFVFPRGGEDFFDNTNPASITFPPAESGLTSGDGMIVIEAAMPWAELGVTPEVGAQMGLDVYMKDNDSGEAARDNQISWSPSGDQAWNNASLFGTVTLVGPSTTIPYGMAIADGEIERIWNVVPENTLAVDIDGTAPESSDVSGYWKAMWDDENLYLLMVTTDDTTVAYPGEAFWNYDMTELFIDPDNSKGEDYDDVDDSQFVFPRGGEDFFANTNPAGITFPPTESALGTSGSDIIIEAIIPFVELGITPAEGVAMGMDVYMKDNDSGEASRDNQISWSPSGDQAWNNASLFGTVVLGEPVLPSATIPYGSPVVDGDIDRMWNTIDPVVLGVDIDGTAPETSDLAGQWRAFWDEEHLYLLLETTDDTTVAYPGEAFWNYDMTEIFIDPDYSRTAPYDGVDDSQFVIPRGVEDPFDNTNPLGITWPPVEFSRTDTANGVLIETAIPWSELNVTPEVGAMFGMDVYMKDNDTGEASRDNQISWSPSQDQAWRDASIFGTAILGDSPFPSAIIPHGTVQVDGVIDDMWHSVEMQHLGVDIDGTDPEARDLSGYWKGLYDEEYLYLLLATTDEITVAYPGEAFWNYDMTEIFIDPDYSRTAPYDEVNDSQFVIPRGGEDPFANTNPLEVTWPPMHALVQTMEGVMVEVAIPLSELGLTAEEGTTFGFDVYMKDNDTGEASRDNQISWSPSGDQAWRDATLFGTAIFGEMVYPTAVIPHGSPVVDGEVDRMWNAIDAHPLTVDIDGTAPEAPDFDGFWKAAWDEDYLYLLLETTDDTTVAYPGEAFWNYDMTEIFIDPDYSRGEDYDGVNDSQFVIPRGTEDPFDNTNPLGVTWPPSWFSRVATDNGVRIETAIPWSELNVMPMLGTTFGMDVYMKDNDSGEASRDNQISWSPSGDQAWNDASIFGTVVLGESAFPTAILPTGSMTVDGVIEAEWDAIEPQYLNVDIDGTLPSPGDFSGYWKGAWDSSHLYLLMVTMDDTTVAYPGEAFWNYDMTELFIDPNDSRTTPYDGVDDSQFVIPRGGEAPFANANPLGVTWPPISTTLVSEEGMIVIETAIPWSELGIQAYPGTVFGMDVYMKDNDSGEASRDNQISWSPSQDQAWRDATLFGHVYLDGGSEVDAFALLVDAIPMASGYMSPWFGTYEARGDGWIEHTEWSWLFVDYVDSKDSMWMYSQVLSSWVWTSQSMGGYVYEAANSRWIYFLMLEEEGGFIFDPAVGTWTPIP